jgi:hypothetical protein
MQQIDATVVGQGLGPKRDHQIPRSLWHHSECYPTDSIHYKRWNHSWTMYGASSSTPFTDQCRRIQVNI